MVRKVCAICVKNNIFSIVMLFLIYTQILDWKSHVETGQRIILWPRGIYMEEMLVIYLSGNQRDDCITFMFMNY